MLKRGLCQVSEGKMEQSVPPSPPPPGKHNHFTLNGHVCQFCRSSWLMPTAPLLQNGQIKTSGVYQFPESVITEQRICVSQQRWTVTWNCELFAPRSFSTDIFVTATERNQGSGRPSRWASVSAYEIHASLLMQQEFITSEDNAVIQTSSFFILLMTCDESPCYARCCSMVL